MSTLLKFQNKRTFATAGRVSNSVDSGNADLRDVESRNPSFIVNHSTLEQNRAIKK